MTALTVILTVAVFESTVLSLTVKVKLSLPLKSALGVYVRPGAVPDSDPFEGPAATVYASVSVSTSLAARVIASGLSSGVNTD